MPNEAESESGLEFYTDEQLINELTKRSVGIVVGMVKESSEKCERFGFYWRGGVYLGIGICTRLKDLLRDYADLNEGTFGITGNEDEDEIPGADLEE
jgi:hypothetical protein